MIANGQSLLDENAIEKEVIDFYGNLYRGPTIHKQCEPMQMALFSVEEIEQAIKEVNFSKGVGHDAFDGKILDD